MASKMSGRKEFPQRRADEPELGAIQNIISSNISRRRGDKRKVTMWSHFCGNDSSLQQCIRSITVHLLFRSRQVPLTLVAKDTKNLLTSQGLVYHMGI